MPINYSIAFFFVGTNTKRKTKTAMAATTTAASGEFRTKIVKNTSGIFAYVY